MGIKLHRGFESRPLRLSKVTVASKLQIKPGQTTAVLAQPKDVELELPGEVPVVPDPAGADAVVVFAVDRAELDKRRRPLIESAKRDALTWLAYPKAGKLGTDLNRDSLYQLLLSDGVRPVRQIAIDDTWSALRFRPA
jgi:hypothetical protein